MLHFIVGPDIVPHGSYVHNVVQYNVGMCKCAFLRKYHYRLHRVAYIWNSSIL